MKNILIFLITLTHCFSNQFVFAQIDDETQDYDKVLRDCIYNRYYHDTSTDVFALAQDYEIFLLENNYLKDRSKASYENLIGELIDKKFNLDELQQYDSLVPQLNMFTGPTFIPQFFCFEWVILAHDIVEVDPAIIKFNSIWNEMEENKRQHWDMKIVTVLPDQNGIKFCIELPF
ncbi:MAG: hypothetical protein ACNS62_21220 [Candidatus Cyclobacteriaceae bacterium M3_2C_046]